MQLAIAPHARQLLVYNAPNDFTGQTELDEYTKIANDDTADVVSSSWGLCENDAGAAYAQAENLIFEQMAAQRQSMFGASGDTGTFSCIRSDGTNIVNVLDPPSQPWVTSVGGTSFESFNPNANPDPRYPKGVESVWNVDNLCNRSANEGSHSGFFWCAETGAAGGGSSQFWGRPNSSPVGASRIPTQPTAMARHSAPWQPRERRVARCLTYPRTPIHNRLCRILHRKRCYTLQHVCHYQRKSGGLVRNRRHQPFLAFMVGGHRGP
jgi:hypothetical protein